MADDFTYDVFNKTIFMLGSCITFIFLLLYPFTAAAIQSFNLKMGKMADYGATPWHTDDIYVGTSPIRFALDSGANFTWATSDQCCTSACDAHNKVDTSQPGFAWMDKTTTTRSFGPWGAMQTWTGKVHFNTPKSATANIPFFAAVSYTKDQFRYLDWGGGIGFPSSSEAVEEGSGFYFYSLYESGAFENPTFSVVTHPEKGFGSFFLGGDDPTQYDENSEIELRPDRTGKIKYLWGTPLYSAQLNDKVLPSLTNSRFYLDTGSSVFKGDGVYLTPILTVLYDIKNTEKKRIFEKVYDTAGNWVGLAYANGGDPFKHSKLLPDFTLTMGQSCGMQEGKAARISLNAQQYSYYVEEGDREGKWVIAFTRLDGVGGLLVGSTFMDLLYTTFNYNTVEKNTLTQGNMYLYKKSTGRSPSALTCVSLPEDAAGDSPVSGTWYNSYCSQIELSVSPSRKVKGVYTSHTGSAGASNVVGWVGTPEHNAKPDDQINGNPVSPNGTPISLGIQWRLINQSKYDMDGSWHWVSTFSGQYHPAQIVRQEDQDDYLLDETLEIFNGLLATATVPEFTDTVPTMWPQTLEFHRTPPSYCRSITPLTSKTCF